MTSEIDCSCSRTRLSPKAKGFTLIEMMIVVAIVAILAAIALPSYTRYVQKSRRVEAKNTLLDFAARQEKHYSTNNVYTDSGTALGYGGTLPMDISVSGASNYSLSVAVGTGNGTFEASATPIGAQLTDACGVYTITHTGVQTNAGTDDSAVTEPGCW